MKLTNRVGIGGSVSAEAVVLPVEKCWETSYLDESLAGKIVVCLAPVGREFIAKAVFLGVGAVVVPSIHFRDLAAFAPGEVTIVLVKQFGVVNLTTGENHELARLGGKKVTISNNNGSYEIATAS